MKAHRLAVLITSVVAMGGCRGGGPRATVVQRMQAPPAGKALVNFHRPSSYGGGGFPVFDGKGTFLCDLRGKSEYQHVVDPGRHFFMGWADQVTAFQADVEAGRVYDVIIDISMGVWQANKKLVPLTKGSARRAEIPDFERRERVVTFERTERAIKYEKKHQGRVEQIKKDFLGGPKSGRLRHLGKDDAR